MDNDKALLNAIAAREESAMESFYRRYQATVYSFAIKVLQHPMDAADVLNEVMMEVWRNANFFSGKTLVRNWLLSITRHKIIDVIRKNARREKVELPATNDSDMTHALIDDNNPMDNIADIQQQKYLGYCLDSLTVKHRQVVYLVFYEGLSYSDIANILDIPEGTVKTRMMHAKKHLIKTIASSAYSAA